MIYARAHSYSPDSSGTVKYTIASANILQSDDFTTYDLPSADWLYLDTQNTIQIYTQAQMDAIALVAATKLLQLAALAQLDIVTGTKGTVIRALAAGVLLPLVWITYIKALRAIGNGTDTASIALPLKPPYPTGT
jgi:hypothetical protein